MNTVATSALVLIDVQAALAPLMFEAALLRANLCKLLAGARLLGVPVLWCEQNPRQLGGTLPELAALLPDQQPMPKMSFSCCGCPAFMQAVRAVGRPTMLLAGVETHVCVYQTARDLVADGCRVEIVADAVSSRTALNRTIGLQRAQQLGAVMTSTEMLLFELLGSAEHPAFRQILKLIK
jgi:nicotinamidase-related amidase